MKFYINKIILWLETGTIREILFFNNKVNIITGEQSKGKSSIIEIIDYCFFSSDNPIVQGDDYISQVDWFGINFYINDKHFTLVRSANNLNHYYFSSCGEIPKTPYTNFNEANIKNAINFEFSINDNVVFPFGGKEIRKGTKISPRYFMLFCTQRRDVLSSDEVLFDKQSGYKNLRYQEALSRIFDIALGVTTIDNLIMQEKLNEMEDQLYRLIKKREKTDKKHEQIPKDLQILCDEAKKNGLLSFEMTYEDSISGLKAIINNTYQIPIIDKQLGIEELENEKIHLQLQLSKYKKYLKQYSIYKDLLKTNIDSLKPVAYLKEYQDEILQLSKTNAIISALEDEFVRIKEFVENASSPATVDIEKKIMELTDKIKEIDDKLSNISTGEDDNITLREQLLFLGEAKKTLELFETQEESTLNIDESIHELEKETAKLKANIKAIDRSDILDTLSQYMQEIFKEVGFSLSGYSDYRPILDFKSKLISLKKIDEKIEYKKLNIVKNIGSSSNHLFLHLAFFTAIHRIFILQNVPYIPPFLIIDQPDSPYYEVKDKDSLERKTFFKALRTLDNHIDHFMNHLKKDFQIIVLEHVEWNEIEQEGYKHFKLVDKEWRNDYGLIPFT